MGYDQFSLAKLLEDADIAKERRYPWKTENNRFGVKQINVKYNKGKKIRKKGIGPPEL